MHVFPWCCPFSLLICHFSLLIAYMIALPKSHALHAPMQSHNLCVMVSVMSFMYMLHLSSMSTIIMAIHKLMATTLCQINQINSPSMVLMFVSHIFLHENLSRGVRMPCHFVITNLGSGCFDWSRFLPMAEVPFINSSPTFHWSQEVHSQIVTSSNVDIHPIFSLSYTNGSHRG